MKNSILYDDTIITVIIDDAKDVAYGGGEEALEIGRELPIERYKDPIHLNYGRGDASLLCGIHALDDIGIAIHIVHTMDAIVIHDVSHCSLFVWLSGFKFFAGDSSKMSQEVETLISTFVSDMADGTLGPDYLSTLSTIITDISGTQEMFSTLVGDLSGNTVTSTFTSTLIADLSGAPIKSPLSINDLLNSYEATVVKEAADRSAVSAFTAPSVEGLKPALYRWAAAGFPGGYAINTLSLSPPTLCTDGVNRALIYYFEYLLGKPIATWLQDLDDITDGMIFTFSHDGSSVITLHVTRT